MASVSKTSTSDGKVRWRARWRGPDGRSHERWFRRRVDADRFVAELNLGWGRHDPRGAQQPVSTALSVWLDGAEPRLSPKTASSYRSLARLLSSELGATKVEAVRTADVQAVVARWQRAGLSPSRIRQAVRLMSQVLEQAEQDGAIGRNPCNGVRLPPMPEGRTAGFTPEQADRITAALPEHYRLLGEVLSHCGLRWAEAVGLRVEQVDFARRRIIIDRSTSQVDGRLHDRTTKTGRARTVPITSGLSERLQRAVEGLQSDERVFVGRRGLPLRYDRFRKTVWIPTLEGLGMSGGVHSLRKAATTRFLRAGVAPHVVARIMGHSDVQVTLRIYSEVVDQDLDGAADLLERGALGGFGGIRQASRSN